LKTKDKADVRVVIIYLIYNKMILSFDLIFIALIIKLNIKF
jgi:hypothetical protein